MNRFEWLKAVAGSEVSDRAKAVATILAIKFCNEQTGQLDPSIEAIATASGRSIDSAKRAIRDLIKAGWLARSEGRGRGNTSQYTLLSPGKVVAISSAKKGAQMHPNKGGRTAPSQAQKGAELPAKGCRTAPSHYKDEQSFEQKGRESATARPSPHLSAQIAEGSDAAQEWDDWLAAHGKPTLAELTALHVAGAYELTHKRPPRPTDTTAHMIALRLVDWAENKGARHDHAA